MPAVFNELDIVVSSSLSEAMPLAVMEAMASGVPVVETCKVGGIPDLIEHGITGWLADEGDYEELATRVVDLIEDEELRLAAGNAARGRAVGRLGLEQSVEVTARLFAQLDWRSAATRAASARCTKRDRSAPTAAAMKPAAAAATAPASGGTADAAQAAQRQSTARNSTRRSSASRRSSVPRPTITSREPTPSATRRGASFGSAARGSA